VRSGTTLLAYADRLGGDIPRLRALVGGPLRDFAGVHLLPFFTPFDGDDAGFDPVDHSAVDPRLGTWDDVRAIEGEVMADLIVNHVSAYSAEFVDWLAHGSGSAHDGMFLTFDTVFPSGATAAEITAFYRPRPGLPFTAYRGLDGSRHLVWTTFMPSQVDLDVAHPAAHAYFDRVLAALRDGGVTTVRLDAVGYAVKTPGTDSFMTEHTLAFVAQIADRVRAAGMRVLVEVHAHYTQQLAIAPLVDLVYDFALAPLLLHAFVTGDPSRLDQWLRIRPGNALVVLDTHDGIGIIDAGPSGGLPGLLDENEMAAIFASAAIATGGHSTIASVVPTWASMPHQINATFFSAMGQDARRYVTARAVQFFVPGEPQVYYVGLLAGVDDVELFARTGQGRDVNRHVYDEAEFAAALEGEVAQAILGLVRLRSWHPAFDGDFAHTASGGLLTLRWTAAGASATLTADFSESGAGPVITLVDGEGTTVLDSPAAIAAFRRQ
jgi:sucrose phosphorylase